MDSPATVPRRPMGWFSKFPIDFDRAMASGPSSYQEHAGRWLNGGLKRG